MLPPVTESSYKLFLKDKRSNNMEATFTVRVATSKQVKKAVAKLSLPKNENGQYTHVVILILKKQITRILAV